MHQNILLSWSSGKDSAWGLHRLRQDKDNEVVAFLTTVNEQFDRVAMHGVRRELLEAQAEAAGVELWPVNIPFPCSNEQYEEAIGLALGRARRSGVDAIAFGDLFLEQIREYREAKMAGSGLELMFPLWNIPTRELSLQMIDGGLRARLTCIDPRLLAADFAGREWDRALLRDLPVAVDPCGENGEFHTFAYAGPMFSRSIGIVSGAVELRDGFVFADLVPNL
jgi:uncharacterized protein (TIGR00290 family)